MSNFKTILRLLKRDIISSKKSMVVKFCIFYTIFTLCILIQIYNTRTYEIININKLIFNVFKGCGYIEDLHQFKFPVIWFTINSFIIYCVGSFFYDDMKVNGKYLLIRTGKMILIYISKLIWSFIMVILYYTIMISICVIIGYLLQSNICINAKENLQYLNINTITMIKMVFFMYTLTSFSLIVIFINLSINIEPVYAFLLDIVLCIVSVFSNNVFWIGQHSLLLRHMPFNIFNGITLSNSIVYNFTLIVFFVLIGCFIASQKEMF